MIVGYFFIGIVSLLAAYVLFLWICSLLVNPNQEYEQNSCFYRFLLNSATGIGLKALHIRVHVCGMEKVPVGVKLVFVGNHRSNFDPIITWYVFQKWQIAFISKAENFEIPIFGRLIRKCCFMVIDRENPRNALTTVNKAAKLLEKQEVSIGVYPEGTRSKTGELLPFHNGVFKIAKKAAMPIVVLSVIGTEQIHRNTPFHKSDVYLDVVDVLPAAEVKQMKTAEIGDRVRKALASTNKR